MVYPGYILNICIPFDKCKRNISQKVHVFRNEIVQVTPRGEREYFDPHKECMDF